MGEDRFNALILLYVHKDIEIDISKVVEMYARQYQRRMLLFNHFPSDLFEMILRQ